jgi:hypothetical protein
MNVHRWFSLWVAAAGLLAGAPALMRLGSARAADDYQNGGYETDEVDFRNQNNPEIRCLPFVKVPRKVPKAPRQLIEHQQHKGCIACHESSDPSKHRGDHPKVVAATALVVNPFKRALRYEAKFGKGDWQAYTLGPGKARRHTYKYKRRFVYKSKTKSQRKKHQSPPVWVRYEMDGRRQEFKAVAAQVRGADDDNNLMPRQEPNAPEPPRPRVLTKLKLIATPRREFGNVYYFKKKHGRMTLVATPKKLLYR